MILRRRITSPIATTIREVPFHRELNPMKMLQLSAAALLLSAFAYGGVSAAEKKKEATKRPPACNSLKAEADCTAREDCTWVAAVMDKKSGKEKRRADRRREAQSACQEKDLTHRSELRCPTPARRNVPAIVRMRLG